MGNAWNHFKTISYHKYLVAMGCFRVGLYRQGLLHDLSKYSPTEFRVGMRYYQGTRSPNDAERELRGYSSAWLHHKGRNRHHFEYWVDYSGKKPGETRPVPMPGRYIAEMIMDRIAACKIYKGKDYTDSAPYEYYLKGKNNRMMHQDTEETLGRMLKMLAEEGEEKTFRCIREELVKKKHVKRRSRTGNNRRKRNTIQ